MVTYRYASTDGTKHLGTRESVGSGREVRGQRVFAMQRRQHTIQGWHLDTHPIHRRTEDKQDET